MFRALAGCVRRCQAPLHQEVEWSPLFWSSKIQLTRLIQTRRLKCSNSTVHTVNNVHEHAGREDRGLKTTSNSRAADTHSVPLLLSFAASSPSIKGSHRGTRQLIVAAQPMELSEQMKTDSCHPEEKTCESREIFDATECCIL